MKTIQKNLRAILRYPSALVGMLVILGLIILSVYTVITIPYAEAIRLWRGGEEIWYKNPRQAAPAWFNLFAEKKQSVSFALDSAETLASTAGSVEKTVKTKSNGESQISITYTFDYQYDEFPQEMALYFKSKFLSKQPYASVEWTKPDGKLVRVTNLSLLPKQTYRFAQDERLQRLLMGKPAMVGLFSDPKSQQAVPLKGLYKVVVSGITFEKDSQMDVEFVLHGTLFGLAGTDHMRRDLMIALLWGTPIALSFGLLAALGSTATTMVIAATGAWYGGWVDELIQRVTEINLVLPFLPILIMIGTFYSRSIWLMLGATILLSIFGGGIKTYRAMFIQVKESPYIEAARAYGASDLRIIIRYLSPRLVPTLIPQLVTLIPSYVFLEATLAVLGLGDPVLPTWGKVISDARSNGALYGGLYYWVLEPAILLMVAGLAFALLGFALDRIFNPRLREI
jgi:peptide/nickel transport system permease protein